MSAVRALGGAALIGERAVRFVHFDEAGVSHPQHEPYLVVAGVIINADRDWKAVEVELSDLADRRIQSIDREGFIFHATELFSGGKNVPRERYDKESRWAILDELLSIPARFQLPISVGVAKRADIAKKYAGLIGNEVTQFSHGTAFVMCAAQVELFMRTHADGEVATFILEDNELSRTTLKGVHDWLRHPDTAKHERAESEYIPLTRIVETAFFAKKTDSSPLQLADACAFAVKRFMQGAPDGRHGTERLKIA